VHVVASNSIGQLPSLKKDYVVPMVPPPVSSAREEDRDVDICADLSMPSSLAYAMIMIMPRSTAKAHTCRQRSLPGWLCRIAATISCKCTNIQGAAGRSTTLSAHLYSGTVSTAGCISQFSLQLNRSGSPREQEHTLATRLSKIPMMASAFFSANSDMARWRGGDRDGEEVTEPEQVVEVFRQHYETLGQLPTSATFDEGHSQHAQAVAQWASG
jgi:hypothetical protein